MISLKIYKILVMGLIAVFFFGTSTHSYAAKSKKHSQKKQSTVQVSKKSTSKSTSRKKSSSAKKKTSVKKTSSKKKSVRKGKSTLRNKRTSVVSRTSVNKGTTVKSIYKAAGVKDTTYVNPDDLPALEDDSEDLPVETQSVKVSELLEKYVASNQNSQPTDSINHKEKIIMEIIKYLDTPYKFGGNTSKGIDCSAFTKTIYGNTFSLELPRTAREQYQLGREVNNKTELKFGDLVFFNTRRRVKPGHVGIYIGDNLFAHSSSKQGVMVSSLETEFYSKRFMGGRRVETVLIH